MVKAFNAKIIRWSKHKKQITSHKEIKESRLLAMVGKKSLKQLQKELHELPLPIHDDNNPDIEIKSKNPLAGSQEQEAV